MTMLEYIKYILKIIKFLWFGSISKNIVYLGDRYIKINRILLLIILVYHYMFFPIIIFFLFGMFLNLNFSVLISGIFAFFIMFIVDFFIACLLLMLTQKRFNNKKN